MIDRFWRQVAYNSISLRTLIPVTRSTAVGSEHGIRWIPIVQIGSEAKSALLLRPTATISYKLVVPSNGNFCAGIALVRESWGQNHGGVEFEVCVRSGGKSGELKRKKLIDPTRRKRHRRWVPFQLALRRFANQEVEVTLATSVPEGTTNAFAWAVWGDPAVLSRKPVAELHRSARQHIENYGFAGTLRKVRAKFKQLGGNVPTLRQPHPFWYSGPNGGLGRQPQLERMSFSRVQEVAGDDATSVYGSVVEMVPRETIDVKLSIVIPTKNALVEEFESTLHAIRRQKGIREIETIVVDSGSKDNTVALARAYGANVYCILPEQFNHGLTRNYGAEQTSGEMIAFMVQDAIPATDDLFYKMVQALRSNDRVAGVSVRQVPKSNADIIACWERWNHNNFYIAGNMENPTLPSREEIKSLTVERLRFLAGLDNSCSVVRREVWDRIKFDTIEYGEDIRFGLRCLDHGYRIGWLPDCSIIHSHTRSAFEYLARYYLDKRILLEMFKRDDGLRNLSKLTPEEVLMSANDLYLAIGEFLSSAASSAFETPSQRLNRLCSYLGSHAGSVLRATSTLGDPSLGRFFEDLGLSCDSRLPRTNLCVENFQSVLNSIIPFIVERYPRLSDDALTTIIYKAFAIGAGSFLGEYYHACKQSSQTSTAVERIHAQLSSGAID